MISSGFRICNDVSVRQGQGLKNLNDMLGDPAIAGTERCYRCSATFGFGVLAN
jgi:hypothetical protein